MMATRAERAERLQRIQHRICRYLEASGAVLGNLAAGMSHRIETPTGAIEKNDDLTRVTLAHPVTLTATRTSAPDFPHADDDAGDLEHLREQALSLGEKLTGYLLLAVDTVLSADGDLDDESIAVSCPVKAGVGQAPALVTAVGVWLINIRPKGEPEDRESMDKLARLFLPKQEV
jgi:signal transduction histidine kinase